MASLYIRSDSPYYWIRYYDVREEDPDKRAKGIPTKIPVTAADMERRLSWIEAGKIGRAPKVRGNNATKLLIERLVSAKVDIDIEDKTGLKLKPVKLLHSGFLEFLRSKPQLAESTVRSYKLAERHLLEAIGDKDIYSIGHKDIECLLKHFKQQEIGLTTQAIYTRSLSALFRFFFKKRYIEENPIIIIETPEKKVEPIPQNDMQTILSYFEEKQKFWEDPRKKQESMEQYYLVYFLLQTGFRISSALAQTWEKIDMKDGIITATNVKARGKEFFFPIHPELNELLLKMKPGKGYLFSYSYRRGTPVFWKRAMKKLYEEQKIQREYHIHDLRKTFASWMANKGVHTSVLQNLLDHSDIRVTKKHYEKLEAILLKKQFKRIKFKS